MNKLLKSFLILFFSYNLFLLFFNSSFCKCIFDNELDVAKIHIDTIEPNFELLNIYNSNSQYPSYANKNHIIKIQIKLIEKNILINNFNQNTIKYYIGNQEVFPTYLSFNIIFDSSEYQIYELLITNISFDGSLRIVIPERYSL